MEDVRAIVIDNGTSSVKAGYAGDDAPLSVFPCVVGRPKYYKAMLLNHKQLYVGDEAMTHRGVLSLQYPVKNGIVEDWDIMETVWKETFKELAPNNLSTTPVLLTEVPHNPKANREKMIEIMFETFDVPATYIALQALLGVYAVGRSIAIVLDIGDGVSHIVPVYEGYTVREAVTRVNFGGRNVTEHLMDLLNQRGYSFKTTAEREIVREMKEQLAYISMDNNYEKAMPSTYELPDGQLITLTDEKFKCAEILFSPFLIGNEFCGIHEMVLNSIMNCNLDQRRDFFHNICVTGGSTLIPGLPARLSQEIKLRSPYHKANVICRPERKYATWIGGSILASLSTFQSSWISKDEYDEVGPEMAHRRGYSARYSGREAAYSN